MAKLYKAVDKMDGEVSGWLVAGDKVAVTPWVHSNSEKIRISKELACDYDYQDIEAFERRAINPVLIAEW